MTPIALAAAGWTVRENPTHWKAERGIHTIEAGRFQGLWWAELRNGEKLEVYTRHWNTREAALDTLAERAWSGTTVGAFALGVAP